MEGSMGIEYQMIAIERLLAGDTRKTDELLREGRAMEDEALERMTEGGLLGADEIHNVKQQRESFRRASDDLLRAFLMDECTVETVRWLPDNVDAGRRPG